MSVKDKKFIKKVIFDLEHIDGLESEENELFFSEESLKKDIDEVMSVDIETIEKDLIERYGIEKLNAFREKFHNNKESNTSFDVVEGINFLFKKGKKFLEQTFDGIGYVHSACYVTALGNADNADNLGTLVESGVQVAVTDLRIGQTGDEIKINVRWLSEEDAPKEAPQLVCSFMGRESEAAWADWLVNGQTQQVVLKSGQTLAVEDDENLIVRSSWSADENLLLVDVVKRD